MEKQVAGADIRINAPIETVWHAITNSEIALMPGTVVKSGWGPGDPITFEGEFNGKHFKDYGEIVDKDGIPLGNEPVPPVPLPNYRGNEIPV